MLRRLAALLPQSLASSRCAPACSTRGFRSIIEGDLDLDDPEVLKKYVGVRDHLSQEPATRETLTNHLEDVLAAVQELPESSGYRQAVEATCNYRLKVLEANESLKAVEEVLNAHMEELVAECNEEMHIIPMMAERRPWDVPAEHKTPVYSYQSAEEVLGAQKK